MRNISLQAREGARIVEVRDDVPHFLLTLVVEGRRVRRRPFKSVAAARRAANEQLRAAAAAEPGHAG